MNWYLKCYYGYKNRWDELLAVWAIQRLFHTYDIQELYIESWDPSWMKTWLDMNHALFEKDMMKKIHIVWKNWYKKLWSDIQLFFGGGELFTDQRPFPYDGWTYLFKFWKQIFSWKVIMIWGMGSVRKWRTQLLYLLTLRQAKKIICRDAVSFALAKKYSRHVELYHDFALDVMDVCTSRISTKSLWYSLINVNSHIMNNEKHIQTLLKFAEEHSSQPIYFFPCDMHDDLKYYSYLSEKIPHLKLYDWTTCSLQETLQFIAGSEHALWTRLHFLLVLKYFNKKYIPIVYQEKIEKMILHS